jgi:hypothetical protein
MQISKCLFFVISAGAVFASRLLAGPVIVVRADEPAQVIVDTGFQQSLSAYVPVEIQVGPGKYLVAVVATADAERFEKVVEVKDGKEFVLADLAKVRAERKAAEQAQKDQRDRENSKAQRSQCQEQLKQLQQQYDSLMTQYQAEVGEAQQYNQLSQSNGATANTGGGIGALGSLLKGITNGIAQQHQQKATMLQMQMQQVRTRMTALGCSSGSVSN